MQLSGYRLKLFDIPEHVLDGFTSDRKRSVDAQFYRLSVLMLDHRDEPVESYRAGDRGGKLNGVGCIEKVGTKEGDEAVRQGVRYALHRHLEWYVHEVNAGLEAPRLSKEMETLPFD